MDAWIRPDTFFQLFLIFAHQNGSPSGMPAGSSADSGSPTSTELSRFWDFEQNSKLSACSSHAVRLFPFLSVYFRDSMRPLTIIVSPLPQCYATTSASLPHTFTEKKSVGRFPSASLRLRSQARSRFNTEVPEVVWRSSGVCTIRPYTSILFSIKSISFLFLSFYAFIAPISLIRSSQIAALAILYGSSTPPFFWPIRA